MLFNEKQIAHVAKLARIKLSEEEKGNLAMELSKIVALADELAAIDTVNTDRLTSVADIELPMREDIVTEKDESENLMKVAPNHEYNFYRVPKVIDNE